MVSTTQLSPSSVSTSNATSFFSRLKKSLSPTRLPLMSRAAKSRHTTIDGETEKTGAGKLHEPPVCLRNQSPQAPAGAFDPSYPEKMMDFSRRGMREEYSISSSNSSLYRSSEGSVRDVDVSFLTVDLVGDTPRRVVHSPRAGFAAAGRKKKWGRERKSFGVKLKRFVAGGKTKSGSGRELQQQQSSSSSNEGSEGNEEGTK